MTDEIIESTEGVTQYPDNVLIMQPGVTYFSSDGRNGQEIILIYNTPEGAASFSLDQGDLTQLPERDRIIAIALLEYAWKRLKSYGVVAE